MASNIPNAAEAYTAARERIRILTDTLENRLVTHDTRHTKWRGDWGLVGDLNHVARLLAEAVQFLEAEVAVEPGQEIL